MEESWLARYFERLRQWKPCVGDKCDACSDADGCWTHVAYLCHKAIEVSGYTEAEWFAMSDRIRREVLESVYGKGGESPVPDREGQS